MIMLQSTLMTENQERELIMLAEEFLAIQNVRSHDAVKRKQILYSRFGHFKSIGIKEIVWYNKDDVKTTFRF